MKGWNLKVTSLKKEDHLNQTFISGGSILNFRGANRSRSWKILNYVQIWHLVKEKKYWIIWSNNLVKHGLTILCVLHWNQLSFSPWPSVGQPPVRCQVVCVFFWLVIQCLFWHPKPTKVHAMRRCFGFWNQRISGCWHNLYHLRTTWLHQHLL